MGYDSFGLPAEQYAIQTGQHPAVTTEQNIKRYREQLDKIGFSFDWDREVRTSDPEYYKWTQWIFIQLFNYWYNPRTHKAEKIESLISIFEKEGFKGDEHEILTGGIEEELKAFTPGDWKNFDEKKKQQVLMHFRLAYLGEAYVNWCTALGTVLANDEVKDGVSERGGHPVERKLMKQWSLRITAYAQRLLDGLDGIDWSESLKEAQRNWIGRSEGCSVEFRIPNSEFRIEVFTTRPDTIFGVTFVTLAPEHELVSKITTPEYKQKVEEYITFAKNRSERERMADVKNITGQFTGAYVIRPFSGEEIPVWIADYVLAGYGTGAVMAVPGHDSRDHAFAKHFQSQGLEILQVIEAPEGHDIQKESYDEKEGKCINSDFLNGLDVKVAIKKAIEEIEKKEIGKHKVNYRLRDAVFGRQRYWGEPIPVYYKDGIAHTLPENELPLILPEIDKFLPTETGEPPLARAKNWYYTPTASPLPSPKEREKDFAYKTANSKNWPKLRENAKANKLNATKAEEMLWSKLKADQLGIRFRRQHVIDNFIADFFCLPKELIIEVDGSIHELEEQKEYDKARENILKDYGYHILRFTNEEVLGNIEEVIKKIKEKLNSLPLGEDKGGAKKEKYPLETTTMPGWAGSSWYFLRYMDAKNPNEIAAKDAINYWGQIDLYVGGAEHATGHLLYFRFWNLFLHDLGIVPFTEPAKKLVNQGMIQGIVNRIFRVERLVMVDPSKKDNEIPSSVFNEIPSLFISSDIRDVLVNEPIISDRRLKYVEKIAEAQRDINDRVVSRLKSSGIIRTSWLADNLQSIEVPLECVNQAVLDIDKILLSEIPEFKTGVYLIGDAGYFSCGQPEIGKMSKRWLNVVNPDQICSDYGADSLRLYEMFLGPLTEHKPWDTKGIEGVYRFLRKTWRLFYNDKGEQVFTDAEPAKDELKALHKCIKKVTDDIERMSFNTVVSQFMITVNELTDLKCYKKQILEPFLVMLSPYAPHIAEELWNKLGHNQSVATARWPVFDESYLIESTFSYPVSFNGKTRFHLELSLLLTPQQIEKEVMANEQTLKYLEGKTPKKVIVVPKRIVNIVF
jgi:leucyl-tRNA synthetase